MKGKKYNVSNISYNIAFKPDWGPVAEWSNEQNTLLDSLSAFYMQFYEIRTLIITYFR